MTYNILGTSLRGAACEYLYMGTIDICVVLVAGKVDYAAYEGIGSEQFVAAQGHKLTFQQAKGHFPSIEKDKYREY